MNFINLDSFIDKTYKMNDLLLDNSKKCYDLTKYRKLLKLFKNVLKSFNIYDLVYYDEASTIVPICKDNLKGMLIISKDLYFTAEIGEFITITLSAENGLNCFASPSEKGIIITEFSSETGVAFSSYYDEDACKLISKVGSKFSEEDFKKYGIIPDDTFNTPISENFIDDYINSCNDIFKENTRKRV